MEKDPPRGKLQIKGRDKSHCPKGILKDTVTALNLTLRWHPAELDLEMAPYCALQGFQGHFLLHLQASSLISPSQRGLRGPPHWPVSKLPDFSAEAPFTESHPSTLITCVFHICELACALTFICNPRSKPAPQSWSFESICAAGHRFRERLSQAACRRFRRTPSIRVLCVVYLVRVFAFLCFVLVGLGGRWPGARCDVPHGENVC